MMPWFIWNGKNSLADFGLWIGKLPKRIRPEERYEEVEIPGRAGSVVLLEGEDVYSAYSDEMVVIARNTLKIDRIVEWLRGSSDLILSTDDINKAREARIVGQVAFERISNDLMQATIPFLFQPFRKTRYPQQTDRITLTATSGSIVNPGDVASKPLVSITGSGNKDVTIAGNEMSFTHLERTIKVDCDAQIITARTAAYNSSSYYYKGDYCTASSKLYIFTDSGTGSTLVSGGKREEITDWDGNDFDYIWPGTFSGDFWRIPKGTSATAQSSNTTVVIDPNWRWF